MTPAPKPTPRLKTPKKPLRRSGKIRVRRRSKRFARRREPACAQWIRRLPCVICRRLSSDPHLIFTAAYGSYMGGPSDAAHVKTRGSGGDDIGNLIPLCRRHHQEQHRIGVRSFEDRHLVDLTYEARSFAALYQLGGF